MCLNEARKVSEIQDLRRRRRRESRRNEASETLSIRTSFELPFNRGDFELVETVAESTLKSDMEFFYQVASGD